MVIGVETPFPWERAAVGLVCPLFFFPSFPVHLVQSVAGQQLPSHIPLIKIGGQSRVVAGVTLKGGRRRFSGVLTAGGAHCRGGGGLVPRTGCRGRVRPLGFVHLKPRGRDGSELGASTTLLRQVGPFLRAGGSLWSSGLALPGHQAVHAWPATEHRRQTPALAPGHSAAASRSGGLQHPSTRGCSHSQVALAQPSSTEPRSANRAALAPVGAQKETTPFPRAVLQPQPRHRGPLRPCWEHVAQLCPALGE